MKQKQNHLKLNKAVLTIKMIAFFVFFAISAKAQLYKDMMHDNSVNIYDVVEEAEKYFETHPKGKGSGWKGYQRWLYENEPKFYPSGDRSNADPYFVSKAYRKFVKENPSKYYNEAGAKLFDAGWQDLGPEYIEEVTGHYAVGLGRVESFYVDPSDNQRIYLGSRSGGFWKTINGGDTWQGSTTDYLPASGVNTMDAYPTDPDRVLINVRNAKNGTTHGVYRSIDAGDNWTETDFNPDILGWGGLGSDRKVFKIAYHPSVSDLVFIGTNEGLFRSTDDLANWTQLLSTYNINEIAFHPTNPNIVYLGASNNKTIVLVSTDGGVNFSTTSIPGNTSSVHLSTSADCPNCVYVGTSDGIWKSTNEGASFSSVSTPGLGNYGAFAVSDLDVNDMLFGDIDTHMSSDEGLTFTQATFWSEGNANYNTTGTYVHADIRGAKCQNGVFWVNTDGFLANSSDNGLTWQIFEGQGIRENYNLGVSQSNHYRTICGSQDNGTSINTESGWIEFYGADGMEGIIHPLNDDYMIGSLQNGGRRRTLDGGLSQDGVTPSDQTGYWIAPLFYDPNEQMTVYSLGENVYRSEDFGSNWTNVGTPAFTGTIKYAAIAENDSDIIVVARNQNIEKSIDGGATFSSIKSNLPDFSITDVAFDPNDDNVIVVTYGRYLNDNAKVYITTDQGANWQNITHNLNNMPVRSVAIDHTNASTIYLGTEIGVYKKPMVDNTWSLYNPDLPNMTVLELEVVKGSNTLRAATWGRGLWEFTLDGREDYPAIVETSITHMPTDNTPKEGVDQFVTSVISSDNAILNAYVEWSVDAPTFGNVIAMSNSGGDTWVSDTPLPDSPAGSKMYFKVFAVNSNGDITETYKFMYTVKPFEYCNAVGTSDNGNLYIKEATVSSMTNTSGNDAYSYNGNSLVELETNASYNITVKANTGWASNDYGAWIDYNGDATFDQSEEILFSIGSGSTATANFTVPQTALTEQTLSLRIRLSYWGSSPASCGSTLGEVEDYPVFISKVPISIPLNAGWTWFSVNLTAPDMSLGNVLSSIPLTEGDFIKNQTSSATFYAGYGWFGNLTEIDPREMYMIKLANSATLEFVGTPVDVNTTPIPINEGWTWIGYLPQEAMEITSALSTLGHVEDDFIKSQINSSTFYANFGWFGNLEVLSPFAGYKIKMNNADLLNYPEGGIFPRGIETAPYIVDLKEYSIEPTDFEFTGSLTAQVLMDEEMIVSENDLLMAYSGKECRGIAVAKLFPGTGLYEFPLMVYSGLAAGDALSFRYYDSENDAVYDCVEKVPFTNDMVLSGAFDPMKLHIESALGIEETSNPVPDLSIYPNPFSNATMITYNLVESSNVKISVFDVYGKLVKVLNSSWQPEGKHKLKWEAGDTAAGTYMMKISTDRGTIVRKVILSR